MPTTIIQGDLDKEGKVFESIIRKFKENVEDVNAGYNYYNKDNLYRGTHIRLLIVAAMMTCGDILELGTHELSNKLLRDIIEKDSDDNKRRLIIFAESGLDKLEKLNIKESEHHQLLHVPDCKGKLTHPPYKCLIVSNKLAGDEAALDTIKELCGELCNLDKEVPKHGDEFLGTVRSKVRETLESALLKH